MWDLPRPGVKPVSLALAGGLLTSRLLGKSWIPYFWDKRQKIETSDCQPQVNALICPRFTLPTASGDTGPTFAVNLSSFSLHQCVMSNEGPPPRSLLLVARHSWWLQLISGSGNIVDNVISETWKALSRRAICSMSVWAGASAATLPPCSDSLCSVIISHS